MIYIMFCIFPALSLPRVFTFEATEKGLRHFSFSDVFRTFLNLGACLPFRKLYMQYMIYTMSICAVAVFYTLKYYMHGNRFFSKKNA